MTLSRTQLSRRSRSGRIKTNLRRYRADPSRTLNGPRSKDASLTPGQADKLGRRSFFLATMIRERLTSGSMPAMSSEVLPIPGGTGEEGELLSPASPRTGAGVPAGLDRRPGRGSRHPGAQLVQVQVHGLARASARVGAAVRFALALTRAGRPGEQGEHAVRARRGDPGALGGRDDDADRRQLGPGGGRAAPHAGLPGHLVRGQHGLLGRGERREGHGVGVAHDRHGSASR